MPGFNGMGPTGAGPMTGRGMGRCAGGRGAGVGRCGFGRKMNQGLGYGRGRGFGAGYADSSQSSLRDYAGYLENELKAVKKQLNDIDND